MFNLKVGENFNGTVSKIADYGMFVDLGLVKGLLHISEVLWNKEEKLEDSFQVGDEIEVKVKSFNKSCIINLLFEFLFVLLYYLFLKKSI